MIEYNVIETIQFCRDRGTIIGAEDEGECGSICGDRNIDHGTDSL
jgi:hypothetical protein